jgi:F-type H+-transporting ATPase subunit delta
LVQRSAEETHKVVAEVRSSIELTEDQRTRLAAAIQKATGKSVDVTVIVDPTVLGGIVTTVGDTVIDGSVKSRLEQLKHAF